MRHVRAAQAGRHGEGCGNRRERLQDRGSPLSDRGLGRPVRVGVDVAESLDGKVPVLYFVREEWSELAKSWAPQHAPRAEVFAHGKHLMFWLHPSIFNATLDRFLARAPRRQCIRESMAAGTVICVIFLGVSLKSFTAVTMAKESDVGPLHRKAECYRQPRRCRRPDECCCHRTERGLGSVFASGVGFAAAAPLDLSADAVERPRVEVGKVVGTHFHVVVGLITQRRAAGSVHARVGRAVVLLDIDYVARRVGYEPRQIASIIAAEFVRSHRIVLDHCYVA
jgi:hypothetical protein